MTEQQLTCIIEGCDAIGEEVIALLDEASLSENIDKYDEHHDAYQGKNFENNETGNLIPAVVCGKHFDKLIEAYYWQERSQTCKE
jgi:hypothetical protein